MEVSGQLHSCQHSNEILWLIKGEEFLDQLSDYQFLKITLSTP